MRCPFAHQAPLLRVRRLPVKELDLCFSGLGILVLEALVYSGAS